jgi:hypothetical protein
LVIFAPTHFALAKLFPPRVSTPSNDATQP